MASLLSRYIRRFVYSGCPSNAAGLRVQSRPYTTSGPFSSVQAMSREAGPGTCLLTASLLIGFCYWIDVNNIRSGEEGFSAAIYRLWQKNQLNDLNKMQRELDTYKLKLHERKQKDDASVSAKQAE